MKVIGMTGPTGAGKTVVAQLMGLPRVDADQIARQVHNDPLVVAALCRRFGDEVARDGVIDRKRLAAKAFATSEDTNALNAIMHPKILQEIQRQLDRLAREGAALCILDAPLLFQANCQGLCHTTVAVVASRDERKNRIMERDGISEEMAEKRMASQPSEEYYTDRCEYTVHNGGDMAALRTATQQLLQEIQCQFAIGGEIHG